MLEDHSNRVTQTTAVLINDIREAYKEREDFVRAETRLTNGIKARLRRALAFSGRELSVAELREVERLYKAMLGDGEHDLAVEQAASNVGFLEARQIIHKQRLVKERFLEKAAKSLPVWTWVEGVNGFGALGLAIIVGIAGDLSNYSNPAKVWKRFGLAVMDGKAQRKVADAEKAIEMGYSPMRRSAMWTIGDSLLKKPNVYRVAYLDRKEYEVARNPEITKMLAHRRAQRYAEKRLLRDLWREWQTSANLTSIMTLSATEAA